MASQNNNVILRWYDEVWNKGNENAIDELLHPQGKAHGLGAEPLIGPAGFKPFYKAFRNAYSDIHVTVDKMLTEGNCVTALCTVKAKHNETGKQVNFTGTSITELKDGQIMTGWNHFDFLTMNLQTGKIKQEQLV
jgi:predicted ester cyclase